MTLGADRGVERGHRVVAEFVVEAGGDAQCFVSHRVPALVLVGVPLGLVLGVQELQGDETPADVVGTLRRDLLDPT